MNSATGTDSFTIFWDESMGTYRVSVPNLSPNGERVEVVPAVVHEQYREALDILAETAQWYVRCLRDVNDRKPVRGLDEAAEGFKHAYCKARALQEQDSTSPALPSSQLSPKEDS